VHSVHTVLDSAGSISEIHTVLDVSEIHRIQVYLRNPHNAGSILGIYTMLVLSPRSTQCRFYLRNPHSVGSISETHTLHVIPPKSTRCRSISEIHTVQVISPKSTQCRFYLRNPHSAGSDSGINKQISITFVAILDIHAIP
jgi:hypothetical protein